MSLTNILLEDTFSFLTQQEDTNDILDFEMLLKFKNGRKVFIFPNRTEMTHALIYMQKVSHSLRGGRDAA